MTTVQISISGRGDPDEAPIVDDLLSQIADFFLMADGVTASIVGDAQPRFLWRVIGLSKNSPATLIARADPMRGVDNADELAREAVSRTAAGLRELQAAGDRPRFFTDNVLEAADRFNRRLNQRLAEAVIIPEGEDASVIDPDGAFQAVQNIEAVRATNVVASYRELGTIEGVIQSVGADGYGKPFVVLKHRVTGAEVKCYLSGNARQALEKEPVARVVWRRQRAEAFGMIRYRNLGRPTAAEVSEIHFFPSDAELPNIDEIFDPDLTGGFSSSEWLERRRNGDA